METEKQATGRYSFKINKDHWYTEKNVSNLINIAKLKAGNSQSLIRIIERMPLLTERDEMLLQAILIDNKSLEDIATFCYGPFTALVSFYGDAVSFCGLQVRHDLGFYNEDWKESAVKRIEDGLRGAVNVIEYQAAIYEYACGNKKLHDISELHHTDYVNKKLREKYPELTVEELILDDTMYRRVSGIGGYRIKLIRDSIMDFIESHDGMESFYPLFKYVMDPMTVQYAYAKYNVDLKKMKGWSMPNDI